MIFIVGPTATGKSSLAIELAERLNADILSADSRQVYTELAITSGSDVTDFEQNSEQILGCHPYLHKDTKIWGVNFLDSSKDWSIAHFRDFAEEIFKKTSEQGKELIIVGGSGLYLQSLFLDKKQLNIKPSDKLRTELEPLDLSSLQTRLLQQLPNAETLLNESDWKNPRRLIRWIEKTISNSSAQSSDDSIFDKPESHTWIGLTADKEFLKEKIKTRVEERLSSGAVQEVERLLNNDKQNSKNALTSLGVKEIQLFLNDTINREELTELWSLREFQYAKRQLTWFKKSNYIQWVEVDKMFTAKQIDDILNTHLVSDNT